MGILSAQLEEEIERRAAEEHWNSVDELLRAAFAALDGSGMDRAWLEQELLKGLEGEEVEMTSEEWDSIEREALSESELAKHR